MYQTGASASSYLNLFRGAWQLLIKRLGSLANYQDRSLETTWLLSYKRIRRQSPAAADLLRFWACVDYRNLEYDLLKDSKGYFEAPLNLSDMAVNRIAFFDAMQYLMGNSFAQSTGRDKWSLHRVLHKWISVTLKEDTDKSIIQWSVICLGSKAEKRGVSGYWVSSGRLHTHAMRCIESCVDSVKSLNRQDSPEKWFTHLLSLARLCIARNVSLDNARKILIYVMTHDPSCVEMSKVPTPLANSEVSLRAMNALGNSYRDENLYVKAAKTYQRLIEVLDDLGNARGSWLPNACDNYVTATVIGQLQDPWPKISNLSPTTRNILELMRKIASAERAFEDERFSYVAKLCDELRLRVRLSSDDKQSIKVWNMAGTCYANRGDYGQANEAFEEMLPVALKAR